MQRSFSTLALSLALASGVCVAQSQGTGQQMPSSPQNTSPMTPQQPQPGQTQPANPNRPPDSGDSKNSGANMPQTDNAATGDSASAIQSALAKNPNLANADINVQMTDKSVVLDGIVSSQDQKQLAEQIAKQGAGGKKVKNNLKVNTHRSQPNSGPGGDPK